MSEATSTVFIETDKGREFKRILEDQVNSLLEETSLPCVLKEETRKEIDDFHNHMKNLILKEDRLSWLRKIFAKNKSREEFSTTESGAIYYNIATKAFLTARENDIRTQGAIDLFCHYQAIIENHVLSECNLDWMEENGYIYGYRVIKGGCKNAAEAEKISKEIMRTSKVKEEKYKGVMQHPLTLDEVITGKANLHIRDCSFHDKSGAYIFLFSAKKGPSDLCDIKEYVREITGLGYQASFEKAKNSDDLMYCLAIPRIFAIDFMGELAGKKYAC